MSINQWKIYCISEQDWSYGYLDDSLPPPVTCFNNTSHEVNLDSQQIIQILGPHITNATIVEESIPTGGNFRCQGNNFIISAGTTGTQTVSWPYKVNILRSFFCSQASQEGDVVNVVCGPNTIAGVLTSTITNGAVLLPVSLTVIQNAMVGYEILVNGVNLGEIITLDPVGLTASIQVAISQTFNAGAYVGLQTTNIKNYIVGPGNTRNVIGASKIGSKYLPANLPVNILYTNNGTIDVNFKWQVEFLY